MSEVFADVPSEGAKLEIDVALDRLSAKEDKPASESQPEKKETVKPSQGGDNTLEEHIPFHKHPRWIKTQKDLQEAKEKIAAFEKSKNESSEVVIPDWYKARYGETEEAKKNYAEIVKKDGELEWLKQTILKEIETKTSSEQQTVKAGEEYVDTQLQEMQAEGMKFEKNALLKFMVDFQAEFGAGALLDSEGNYDFRKSLNLMGKMQAEVKEPSVNKKIASLGGRGKGSAPQSKGVPVLSRSTLRRGNWRDADSGQFVSK